MAACDMKAGASNTSNKRKNRELSMKASPMYFAQKPHDITLVLLVLLVLNIVLITFKEMVSLITNAFIVGALKNE